MRSKPRRMSQVSREDEIAESSYWEFDCPNSRTPRGGFRPDVYEQVLEIGDGRIGPDLDYVNRPSTIVLTNEFLCLLTGLG